MKYPGNKALLLFLLCISCSLTNVWGQRVNADSLRRATIQQIQASRDAQKRSLDSARNSRQRILDSTTRSRKRVADSLAAVRKYRESKRYQDSLNKSRNRRLDSLRNARTGFADSLKHNRQRSLDSAARVRKVRTDSVQNEQKARIAKMAANRKYRESKRFRDSVLIYRQTRLDSVKAVRKAINDSITAVRKAGAEALRTQRKASLDSAMAIRKKSMDSLKAIRKQRADSLAKTKEGKDRQKKAEDKLKQDKKQLAFELKLKKKREAWNNEKMLKKKWSLPRKVIQNTYTRYNYFFNANRKMEEALRNMRNNASDQFDSFIALYPYNPDRDSSTYGPDMDSIIHKASLGIQIHDPRTKWADDLYLLLGQAYYYKGNYTQSSNAFRYVISINQQRKLKERQQAARRQSSSRNYKGGRELPGLVEQQPKKFYDFLLHRSVHNESILWLSRVYTQSNKQDEAAAIMDLLDNEKELPARIKGQVALEKAFMALNQRDYKEASTHLATAASDKYVPDWLRIRCAFLNGQILFQQEMYVDAAMQFNQAIDLHPKIEMDFYARKNLAYSIMNQGGDQESATRSLKQLLNDNKYASYHEQVYYVLGRLAANSGKSKDAIAYLQRSISSKKSTKRQKASSFAALGNLYYGIGEYAKAKLAYDSAAVLGRGTTNDTLLATATKRSKSLDKVTKPLLLIRQQDSLLQLAALSPRDQEAVVRKYLRYLQKVREDSVNAAILQASKPNASDNPDGGDASWYFSNASLMQQGYNDFKRKWGVRQNADNWRRAAAFNGFSSGNANQQSVGDDQEDTSGNYSGLPAESVLLSYIPNKQDQKEAVLQKMQRAFVDLAGAYITSLEDYRRSALTLDTLHIRFPKHTFQAEALYLRYQIALNTNQLKEAQGFATLLQKDYSDTKWAQLVAPREEEAETTQLASVPVSAFYEETYRLLDRRDYGQVLQRTREGKRQYKDEFYRKRFSIMEGVAYAGTGNYKAADSLLTAFVTKYPADSLKPWAESILAFVARNKPKDTTIVDSTRIVGNLIKAAATNKPADTLAQTAKAALAPVSEPVAPTEYQYRANEEHYVAFYFYKMESRAMGVKAGITDFNTFKYSGQNLTTNLQMLQADQGIVIVKRFQTMAHARIYMNAIKGSAQLFKEYKPTEYQFFLISARNFMKLEKDRDIPAYLKFYRGYYK